jgi:hypothetical protein
MSTKWKLAAALLIAVGGTVTVAEIAVSRRVSNNAVDSGAHPRLEAASASAPDSAALAPAAESAARAPIDDVGTNRVDHESARAAETGREIVGTVLDPEGAPVAGAVVGLARDDGSAPPGRHCCGTARSRTSSRGQRA